MSSLINENQQWVDDGGNPIVNGKIYIGDPGLDPVLNPKSIFSDRDLTVALANPVSIDSNGFATTKIFLSGRYSLQVDDASAVTLISELDNGEAEGTVTLTLDNVAGINAITADGVPTIVSYDDNDQFLFEIVNENTADAVTLNIDGLGAKAIKRSFDLDVGKGRFKVGQKVNVIYNAGNDNFELANQNLSVILANQGASIASAATTDLSAATGNNLTISGSTDITGFGTVIAGTIFNLTFSGNLKISYNATSMKLRDKQDLYVNPDDELTLLSLGSGNWKEISKSKEGGDEHAGTIKSTFKSTAPNGWLLLNGSSIAKTSGGTFNDVKYRELFIHLWDNLADAQAAVSSGRGASGQADFDANKTLTMPDAQGMVLVGKDSGTFTTMGDTGGAETHTLTISEMPSHDHGISWYAFNGTNDRTYTSGSAFDIASGPSQGGGGAHNNLQPWVSVNHIIKY